MAEQPDKNPREANLRQRLGEVGSRLRERLLWPLGDWLGSAFEALVWPFEQAAWAVRKKLFWPLQDALTPPASKGTKVPRAATVGVIGALALGSLGAGALVASGADSEPGKDETAATVAQVSEPEPANEALTPILAKTEPEPEGATLKGVRPNFGAKSEEERKAAKKALRELKAKQAETKKTGDGQGTPGSTPSSESTGAQATAKSGTEEGENVSTGEPEIASSTEPTATDATTSNADAAAAKRRKESPLSVAERFAVAFVSYEVGTSGGPINKTFRDTAEEDLFTALRKRPPRQPAGAKVPKARVMNVVGGPRKKKTMEVSVGLLRVDGVSELRLEMEKNDRGWVVKTVRG